MIRVAAFLLGSLPIVWVSRGSFRRPTSHGFSRFFAFESILAIILINVPHWFARPFAARQLASWFLLCVSLVLVVWGFVQLRRIGGFSPGVEVSPASDRGSTERLVTTGIYRHIRHPMYSSLLFLAWGAFLKSVTIDTLILSVLASLALLSTAKTEEAENVARFGQEYRDYMERTRRFVPFLL